MKKSKKRNKGKPKKTRLENRSFARDILNGGVSKKKEHVTTLKEKLLAVYEQVDLQTTCCRQCVCCSVACPQMNYSEFLVILDELYSKYDAEGRKRFLEISIRYFFSNSVVKPCPMLDGKTCLVYEVRPLPCRLYGLWPYEIYENRVQKFIENSDLSREEIPLNTQCPNVKRKNTSDPLTKDEIDQLNLELDTLDMLVGKFGAEEVRRRYNQRTFHDWFMYIVFGVDKLSEMSKFFLAATPEEVDDFVEQLCRVVDEQGSALVGRKSND